MERNKTKTKPFLDFTDKNISTLNIMQKIKEINNDIKETSLEVEVFFILFYIIYIFKYNNKYNI